MGQPTPPFNNRSLVYTSASAAAVFSPPIGWVQVITTGDVILKGQDGVTVTYSSCAAGDILVGPFSAFTSTTSSNIRLGDGAPPPGSTAVAVGIGALNTDATSAKALLWIDLKAAILAAGTPLAAFADNAGASAPGITLNNSKAVGVRWNNQATQTAIWSSVPLPQDLDTTAPMAFKVMASKSGATSGDATTFTITAFAQTAAALEDAASDIGGTTTALVGAATAKTVAIVSLSVATPPTPPAVLSVSIKPTNGTLGTDDCIVEGFYIEYKRKLRTS